MAISAITADLLKLKERSRIIDALLLRDLMTRFGHGNIGFLWLVGEPLLLSVGVIAVWSLIYGAQKHGVSIAAFVLTGYSMLSLWRHMVNRSIRCFGSSSELLFHRAIRPFDIFVARQIVEIFGVLIAFFFAYIPFVLLGYAEPIHDHLIFMGAWFLMSFFTFGLGLIVASLTELSDTIERLVQPVMYLTIPISGAFYLVAWLPKAAQDIVLLSPMVHASEMLRAGYFGPQIPTYWDAGYLFLCGLLSNAVGFAMVVRATRNIET